eukprot:s274_g35.t2
MDFLLVRHKACGQHSGTRIKKVAERIAQHAFIGLGFEDRNDAFDFNCTLADFKSTWIDREKEAEMPSPSSMPAKDLSLKEGQTIKINLPGGRGGKSRRSREAEAGGYGGAGILAPPPSSGSRRQAPAVAMPAVSPAAVPAVPAVSSMSSPAEVANDFFGDFNDFQAAPGDTGGPSRSPQAAAPAEIFGGPSRSPQATPPAVDLFGGPAAAQAASPAPASMDLFGGASTSSPQVSTLATDPFAGAISPVTGSTQGAPAQAAPAPAAPWPGDAFGGFSSSPPKPAAAAPAPASTFSPVRPSPARGKDPFDDLDIFK